MKRKYYFISLLLFCIGMPLHGYAQHKLDSLNTVLKTEKDDTNKVNTLHEICRFYFNRGKYPAADSLTVEFMKVARKINFKKGVADGYKIRCTIYMYAADYPSSLQFADTALQAYKEIGNKSGIADALRNIAMNNYYEGNYAEALKYNFQSLKAYEELGDKVGIGKNYINISYLYEGEQDYAGSLKYDSLALKITRETHDLASQGIIYSKLGVTLIYPFKKYREGIKNLDTSLAISMRIGNGRSISIALQHLGEAYGEINKYDSAMYYLKLAIEEDKQMNNVDGLTNDYNNIGKMLIQEKKFGEAREWIEKALQTANKIGDVAQLKGIYEWRAVLDTATGNFKAAYHDYTHYAELSDSLINSDNIKKMTGEEAAYAFGKKQDSIKAVQLRTDLMHQAETKRQKIITYSVLVGLILVLLLAFSIFRSLQQNKKKTIIIEKEKQRSEELLLNILPSEVAEELKEKGSAEAKHFNEVTVMFTDFKGFTTLGEKLSPKDLVAEINHCFVAYDNIIHNYGIEKIKTIGDSYMAVCGLPNPDNQHAEKVVNACRDIIKFMEEYKEERTKQGQPYFEARVGINTGPVVAGIVGVKKFAYDIWGDTVNIASRMESSGEVGKINISGSTYELVKDKFKCFHRGKIQAKNKGEIDMYFVES